MDYIGDLRKLVGTMPLIMVGANVILVNDNKQILLHHRTDRDWWGLPGGAMELGETLEDTARRETFEEINISCGNMELFNIYSGAEFYYRYPDGNEVYNVTATFLCFDYSGDIVVEKSEGRNAQFFDLDRIPENISSTVISIINDYKYSSQNLKRT